MSLIDVIKQISIDAVKASKPLELISGSVLSLDPFQVKIDQRLILTEAQLTGDYIVTNYSVGDNVTMLRVQGGKKYYILSTNTGGSDDFDIEYDEANEEIII